MWVLHTSPTGLAAPRSWRAPQDPVPAATSLLRGPGSSDDEITAMSQRLGGWAPAGLLTCGTADLPAVLACFPSAGHAVVRLLAAKPSCCIAPALPHPPAPRAAPPAAKKTGRPVALSVNLPSGEPLMRAWAEKRLLQELQALQLVRQEQGRASIECPRGGCRVLGAGGWSAGSGRHSDRVLVLLMAACAGAAGGRAQVVSALGAAGTAISSSSLTTFQFCGSTHSIALQPFKAVTTLLALWHRHLHP